MAQRCTTVSGLTFFERSQAGHHDDPADLGLTPHSAPSPTGSFTALWPVILLSITGMLAVAAPAFAHSRLVSSDPADGASVDTGPTQVSLTFNEDMPPGFDKVAVIGPDGTAWQTGEVTTSGPTISITVSPLGPAGRYQVGYRVVSGDGHPVQGSTSFVLTKAGTGTPPTQPAAIGTPVAGGASGDSSGGGSPVWPWIAAAVVVIGVGVVVALRLGRT